MHDPHDDNATPPVPEPIEVSDAYAELQNLILDPPAVDDLLARTNRRAHSSATKIDNESRQDHDGAWLKSLLARISVRPNDSTLDESTSTRRR